MDSCDVLIVGGGPGGAACAWRLRRAGLDVVVMDRAKFPRDKTCAGWVTPQVLAALEIDADAYGETRTLQPITAFRVGIVGNDRDVTVRYDAPVSVGIRRCEFDHYLVHRSGARLRTGEPVTSIRRDGQHWIVNDTIRAPMLVGAGGHFCPVARLISPTDPPTRVVAAQEIELPLDEVDLAAPPEPNLVTLYFAADLTGYGWCFQKQGSVNIGFGQYEGASVPGSVKSFLEFLEARRILSVRERCRWHGHAYRLYQDRRLRVVDSGVLLVGDAAGLAYSESGEGIRPAIESGLLAAATIVEAHGSYTQTALARYERQLTSRLGPFTPSAATNTIKGWLARRLGPSLVASPWFVRHILVDRWFLHAADRPLVVA